MITFSSTRTPVIVLKDGLPVAEIVRVRWSNSGGKYPTYEIRGADFDKGFNLLRDAKLFAIEFLQDKVIT